MRVVSDSLTPDQDEVQETPAALNDGTLNSQAASVEDNRLISQYSSDSEVEFFANCRPVDVDQAVAVKIPVANKHQICDYLTLSQLDSSVPFSSDSSAITNGHVENKSTYFTITNEHTTSQVNRASPLRLANLCVIPDSQSLGVASSHSISNDNASRRSISSSQALNESNRPASAVKAAIPRSDSSLLRSILSQSEVPQVARPRDNLHDNSVVCDSSQNAFVRTPHLRDPEPEIRVSAQRQQEEKFRCGSPLTFGETTGIIDHTKRHSRVPAHLVQAPPVALDPVTYSNCITNSVDKPSDTHSSKLVSQILYKSYVASPIADSSGPVVIHSSGRCPESLEQAAQASGGVPCSLSTTDPASPLQDIGVVQSAEFETKSVDCNPISSQTLQRIIDLPADSLGIITTPPRPQTPLLLSSMPDIPFLDDSTDSSRLSHAEKRRQYREDRDHERAMSATTGRGPWDSAKPGVDTPSKRSPRHEHSEEVRHSRSSQNGISLFSGLSGLQYPSRASTVSSPSVPYFRNPNDNASIRRGVILTHPGRLDNQSPRDPSTAPVPSLPRRISSIGSMGAVMTGTVARMQEKSEIVDIPLVPAVDLLGSGIQDVTNPPAKFEHYLPLELHSTVRPLYQEPFNGNKECIEKCMKQPETRWTSHDYEQLYGVFRDLNAISSHQDLLEDGSWTQAEVSSKTQAIWNAHISSKFAFLKALYEHSPSKKTHVTLFVRPGPLINMVQRFFDGLSFPYTRADEKNDVEVSPPAQSGLRFTLVPTGDCSFSSRERSDLILGFDGTFDPAHENVKKMRSHGRHSLITTPVVCIVVVFSIEHIMRTMHIKQVQDTKPLRPFLQSVYRLRSHAGRLQRGVPSSVEMGKKVAQLLQDSNSNWSLPSIDDFKISNVDHASAKDGCHQGARKRRRELEMGSDFNESVEEHQSDTPRSQRKRRRDPHRDEGSVEAQGAPIVIDSSSTVSRTILCISRGSQTFDVPSETNGLLDATLAREAALFTANEALRSQLQAMDDLKTQHRLKESALQSAYLITEEYRTAISSLQSRFEDQMSELRLLRRQKLDTDNAMTASATQKARASELLATARAERDQARLELATAHELLAGSRVPELAELETARQGVARAVKLEHTLAQQRQEAEYIRVEYQKASSAAAEHAANATSLEEEVAHLRIRTNGEALKLRAIYEERHLDLARAELDRLQLESRTKDQIIASLSAQLEERRVEGVALKEQQTTRVGMALSTRSSGVPRASSMPPKATATTAADVAAEGIATRAGSRTRSKAGSRQPSPMPVVKQATTSTTPVHSSHPRVQAIRSQRGEEGGECVI